MTLATRNMLARRDPMRGLFVTHRFAIPQAAIATGTVFPVRTRPIVLQTTIEITDAAALGLIFSLGDADHGLGLAISTGELILAAGNGGAGTDGLDGSVAISALGAVGARLLLTMFVHPQMGIARLLVNGQVRLRLQEEPSVPLLSNAWANTGEGSFASAKTANTRLGVGAAPTNFAVVEPLQVAIGQTLLYADS